MEIIDNNIKVRNLGFNQVTTIIIPPWNTWRSKVQNDKGLRITVKYPLANLTISEHLRLTVSTCKGFVDLNSNKSSISFFKSGGVFECMFDITSLSPYVALDPNVQHYINIKNVLGQSGNFDVGLSTFDIGGDVVTCTNGKVTPGFVFDPTKISDRNSIIREFSIGDVASIKIPPKTSSDWGDKKPEKLTINLSKISGLNRPKRWELIISECPGSFDESLPETVGRTRDYHLISSDDSGLIEIQYEPTGETDTSPPTPTPQPQIPDSGYSLIRWNGGRIFVPMQRGEVVAIEVDLSLFPQLQSFYSASVADTINTGFDTDIQVSISQFPGVFSSDSNCSFHSGPTGGEVRFTTKPSTSRTPVCQLPGNLKRVFFNMRQIKRSDKSPSCPVDRNCTVSVNFTQ